MTVEENFSRLASHMVQGMMVHEQLMNSYLFLGLKGYAACHEYHYLSETKGYVKLCKFKMDRYGTICKANVVSDPKVIPDTWYDSVRESVSFEIRKQAMSAAIDEWIQWETETVNLYNEVYKDLFSAGEIIAAEFVKEYSIDAEKELVYAKNEQLEKYSMSFDIVSILEEQKEMKHSFKKRMRHLKG